MRHSLLALAFPLLAGAEPPKLPPLAPAADVKAVYAELALPPRFGDAAFVLPALPFSAAALKPYAADVSIDDAFKNPDKYKLRVGVVRSLDTVRKAADDRAAPAYVTRIDAPVTAATKRSLVKSQEYVAVLAVELELAADELAALGNLRAGETKRWRANYDYALAALRLRVAALHEYNKLLGDVRTESLPDLPAGATGWRLIPAKKLRSPNDVRKLAEQAREEFEALAAGHKGTPWAALAERALVVPPGLAWEPIGK